jgi:hypothetical protein
MSEGSHKDVSKQRVKWPRIVAGGLAMALAAVAIIFGITSHQSSSATTSQDGIPFVSIRDARGSGGYCCMTASVWAKESPQAQHNTTSGLLASDAAALSPANVSTLTNALENAAKGSNPNTNAYTIVQDLNSQGLLQPWPGHSLGIPSTIWTASGNPGPDNLGWDY